MQPRLLLTPPWLQLPPHVAGWLLCRGWPLAADPWPVPAGQESTVSALLRTGRSHRQQRQRAPAAEPAALCHQQARHSERWQQKQQHPVALVALRAARQQRGQPAQILVPQAAKNDIRAHHYRWAGGRVEGKALLRVI